MLACLCTYATVECVYATVVGVLVYLCAYAIVEGEYATVNKEQHMKLTDVYLQVQIACFTNET